MVARRTPRVFIEALESRIAPAVVIAGGGKSAHYTDLDGDRVTVTVSKGKLSAADFVMSSDGASVPGGEKLVMLDLSDDGAEFHRANLTFAAKVSKLGGNGSADVGFINAANGLADLGSVVVDGSLGSVVAGDANDGPRSPGVKLVKAQAFGGSSFDCVGGIAKIVTTGVTEANGGFSSGSMQMTPVGGITFSSGSLGSNSLGTLTSAIVPLGTDVATVPSGVTTGLGKTGAGILQLGGTVSVFPGGMRDQVLGATWEMATSNVTTTSGDVGSTWG